MKNLYQDKLRKIAVKLHEQEAERATFEAEVKKYEHDSQKHGHLQAALKQKKSILNT